jgi:hypothetical protein
VDQQLIEIGSTGLFDLDSANSRVRVIFHFTRDISRTVDQLMARLEALDPADTAASRKLEAEVERLIEGWNSKVRKLGGKPKGLWLVDFDCGDGYFCWKFPEKEIQYWHDRQSGFPGRITLQEREKRLITKLQVLE